MDHHRQKVNKRGKGAKRAFNWPSLYHRVRGLSTENGLRTVTEGTGLKRLGENWKAVGFVVGAPAFMQGKERFSAPGFFRISNSPQNRPGAETICSS